MDENTVGPGVAPALSNVVVPLLKGVIYQENDAGQWQSLLRLQPAVRDYVAVLGLELAVDEAEGYAFLRSRLQDDEDDAAPLPRLVARRPLSFPVSLLLALLRKKLAESDASGGDTRLVLGRDDIVELLRVFLPDSSNEARVVDQVDANINMAESSAVLRAGRGSCAAKPHQRDQRRIHAGTRAAPAAAGRDRQPARAPQQYTDRADRHARCALRRRMHEVTAELQRTERQLADETGNRARTAQKQSDTASLQAEAAQVTHDPANAVHAARYDELERQRADMLGEHTLSVESCDRFERDMRERLQARIDSQDRRLREVGEQIVVAMGSYRSEFPLETQDVDAAIEAADEYRRMLATLQADDLPRFEARFKELLNENTIREVANFQSHLMQARETIRDRLTHINKSLTQIDYNPGRYIVLEARQTPDADIRDFQGELRACTEGALTGSGDEQYSEMKYLQVRRIIERFRGREGQAEQDRRWTAKVTDVRNWFAFAASERWREDDSEHEHYSDSGGKSGGQKEKLAYTILAASLAYQFGLEWGAVRSRSFRFVVIDEAFGRGSDESAQYGLRLFAQLNLQLLIVTPLQKIHIIEPFVSSVGYVNNPNGNASLLRNLSMAEYEIEKARAVA